MNELQYTVVCSSVMGDRYLCCIVTHSYGDRILGFFDLAKSCAMPLSLDQATKICKMLRQTYPSNKLEVIPVPWYVPASEVTGND